jgi:hypothetical protein
MGLDVVGIDIGEGKPLTGWVNKVRVILLQSVHGICYATHVPGTVVQRQLVRQKQA